MTIMYNSVPNTTIMYNSLPNTTIMYNSVPNTTIMYKSVPNKTIMTKYIYYSSSRYKKILNYILYRMSDELPSYMLEEDENINLSWARMDIEDIVTGNFRGQIFQVCGTTSLGLPGALNGYYGILKDFKPAKKGGYFIVDVPFMDEDILMPIRNVLVQQNSPPQESLMLPGGRFLRKFRKQNDSV